MAYVERKYPYSIKGTNLITYTGEAEWCKYLEKSLDTGMYSPRGQYSVNLIADPNAEDFKLFKKKVDAIINQAYDEAMNDKGALKLSMSKKKTLAKVSPFKEHIIKEKDSDGNYTIEKETGKVYITPKLKNVLDKPQGKNYVKLIDANNQEVPRNLCPEVGNGSKIKCKVYVNPYYMATNNSIGVSFIWVAFKIIELNEYSGGSDGEDFEEGEGYTPPSKEDFKDTKPPEVDIDEEEIPF